MSTPTTEQLRARIDRGETGEKVDFPDPAAVPLGADAEAGGHPPTVLERAMDAGRPRPRQRARALRPAGRGCLRPRLVRQPGGSLVTRKGGA